MTLLNVFGGEHGLDHRKMRTVNDVEFSYDHILLECCPLRAKSNELPLIITPGVLC